MHFYQSNRFKWSAQVKSVYMNLDYIYDCQHELMKRELYKLLKWFFVISNNFNDIKPNTNRCVCHVYILIPFFYKVWRLQKFLRDNIHCWAILCIYREVGKSWIVWMESKNNGRTILSLMCLQFSLLQYLCYFLQTLISSALGNILQ